jgi:hypothetical protein
MICKTCVTAGMINKRGLKIIDMDRKWDAKREFDTATSLHDECRGCDCQHTVGMKMTQ